MKQGGCGMGFFYEREESKKEIKIVYKHYPIFTGVVYLGCIVILLGLFNKASWTQPAAFVLLAVVLLQGIAYSGANGEIRRAQNENGTVKYTGKKLSFSNPYTAIIKKERKRKEGIEQNEGVHEASPGGSSEG